MKKTFEEAMTQLEEIANRIESGEGTLEENIELFEEALKLSKYCDDKIKNARKKITEITLSEADEVQELELKD